MLCNNLLADWSNQRANFLEDEGEYAVEEDDDYYQPDEDIAIIVSTAFPTEAYGCHCHHLELVMKHGLEGMFNLGTSLFSLFSFCLGLQAELENLREFARLTRNSSYLRNYICACVGPVPYLPADGTTRWSSTHRLIESFLKHKESWTKV